MKNIYIYIIIIITHDHWEEYFDEGLTRSRGNHMGGEITWKSHGLGGKERNPNSPPNHVFFVLYYT